MTIFNHIRFAKELIPDFITQDHVKKCEPELLPGTERDYRRIREESFLGKSPTQSNERKLYIATAGAPGFGKSTELDLEIASGSDRRYANAVFCDPDRYVMEFMFTYRKLLSAGNKAKLGIEEAAKQAYDRARPGSNIIANLLINEAYDGGYNIIHGTTMTAPTVGTVTLPKLGGAGYELAFC